jgi:hypothetical protein
VSFFTLCESIQTTALSTAIREGALYYPILGAFHLAAIGWFGGMVLVGDLRVLGLGLRHESVSALLTQFRSWKWLGFAVVAISGGLLWWAEPIVCYKSVSFRMKMVLLVLVGLNALVFRKRVYGSLAAGVPGPAESPRARLSACLSLFLWFALIVTGRGTAFF